MSISEIQACLRRLEAKEWPDHVITAVFCEVWEDGGRWVIEVIPTAPSYASKAELLVHVLSEPTQYTFDWPLSDELLGSSATPELAFERAVAYIPTHPEVNNVAK